MFRKTKPLPPTQFMGFSLNLYGKPQQESHTADELTPLLPKANTHHPIHHRPGLFNHSVSDNINNDTFVWQGEKIKSNPEAKNEENQQTLYVLVSKDHKNVYKLLPENEFWEFALKEINEKASLPSPTFKNYNSPK